MTDRLQKMLTVVAEDAEDWQRMSNRQEAEGNQTSAILYRNQAWRLTHGREWLDTQRDTIGDNRVAS